MSEFNSWTVIAPMLVILSGVLGFFQPKIGRKNQLTIRFEDRVYALYSLISTIVVSMLVLTESWFGIIQLLRDSQDEMPMGLKAAITAAFCIGIYFGAVYFTGAYVSAVRWNTLQERIDDR